MQNPVSRYTLIIRRWAWLMILGIVVCGGVTFAVSKLSHPNYQASATLILNECTNQSSAYDCTTAGLEALPTYAQLITSPTVLNPVAAHHPGLTTKQLASMIAVKPQSNTLLMNVDVTNGDPKLAAQLANEVSAGFAQFSNTQLPGTVQVIPAQVPTDPVGLKSSYAAAIGALVGLGLALALIVIFEWVDDRLTGSEEAAELVGSDILTILPELKNKQLPANKVAIPGLAEGSRVLGASLNVAQATKPFKRILVTSALADEGKSTVAANLAFFLAMSGKRVLLVDANLREPRLDRYFELENHQSLAHAFLRTPSKLNNELNGQPTIIPTLQVLTAGIAPSNPAELFQSPAARRVFEHFETTDNFDYIIFDTPPLLPFADTQALAAYAQTSILVVNAASTPRKALARARKTLKRMGIPVLGIVINKSPWPDYSAMQSTGREVYPQYKQVDALLVEPEVPETPMPEPEETDLNGNQEITVTLTRLNKNNEHQ